MIGRPSDWSRLAAVVGPIVLVAVSRADDHVDPSAHIHRHEFTMARHVQTEFENVVGRVAADFGTRHLQECDSRVAPDQDVACAVEVAIAPQSLTFGSADDGLDVITTDAELDAVLDDTSAYVKVVTAINFCGGVPVEAAGCAPAGSTLVLISDLSQPHWGEALIHEFGHNKGLSHRTTPGSPFMHTTLSGNDEVNAAECAVYHMGGTIVGANYPVDLALVIDDSFSMWSEIDGVKSAMIEHVSSFPEDACKAMQLITFKDTLSIREWTTDVETIQEQVSVLSASGGGDCPEASLAAVVAAGQLVKEGGRVLLATDAPPKFGVSLDGVIESLRSNLRHVDVVLAGDCEFLEPERESVNSGDAFSADKRPAPLRPERYRAVAVVGDSLQLFLGGDDWQQVLLPFAFPFGGQDYSTVYVGSNGFVSFGEGSIEWDPSAADLLTGPRRIAPYWEDLSPQNAGTITVVDTGADFRVVFDEVVQWNTSNTVTFTLVLRPDGTFRIDYGTVTATGGLAGCSVGTAVPDPGPIDLTRRRSPSRRRSRIPAPPTRSSRRRPISAGSPWNSPR